MYKSIKVSFKNKTVVDTAQDVYVADSSSSSINHLEGTIKTSIDAAIAHNEATLAAKIAPKVTDSVTYDKDNITSVGSELTDAYSNSSSGLLVTNIDALKESVFSHLESKVSEVVTNSTSYYNTELSNKNTYKDSQMQVKGSKSVAEAMDVFARVVSDAIQFGEDYAGYNGRVQGVSFGDDTYAPTLNSITTTTPAVDLVPGDYTDVFFDMYARVYYVVSGGKRKRIIHKNLNYTVRFAGLGKDELGGNNYKIYPDDDLKYSSGSGLNDTDKVSIPQTTAITILPDVSTRSYDLIEASVFTANPNSGIYYVPKVGNGGDGNFYVVKFGTAYSGSPIYKKEGTTYTLVEGDGYHYSEFLDGTHYFASGTGFSNSPSLTGPIHYYFVPILKGYKAELILTDNTLPTYNANNDVTILHDSATDRYYVYQSKNKPKIVDHSMFTTEEETPGYFLLYTRYGQPASTVPGTTGGVMTKEALLLADCFYWTGEELTPSSVPSNMTAVARS